MVEPVTERNGPDHAVDPAAVTLASRQRQRECDVLVRRQRRDQVEGLENETDTVAAQDRQMVVIELAEVRIADERDARGQRVESRDAMQQRRLPRTGRPHDRAEPCSIERDRHTIEGTNLRRATAIHLHCVDRGRRHTIR
jgi:hypothetical protein